MEGSTFVSNERQRPHSVIIDGYTYVRVGDVEYYDNTNHGTNIRTDTTVSTSTNWNN